MNQCQTKAKQQRCWQVWHDKTCWWFSADDLPACWCTRYWQCSSRKFVSWWVSVEHPTLLDEVTHDDDSKSVQQTVSLCMFVVVPSTTDWVCENDSYWWCCTISLSRWRLHWWWAAVRAQVFPDYAGCGEFQFTKGKLTVKQLAAADLPVVIYESAVAFTVSLAGKWQFIYGGYFVNSSTMFALHSVHFLLRSIVNSWCLRLLLLIHMICFCSEFIVDAQSNY